MTQVLPASDAFTSSGFGSWDTTLFQGLYLRARGANTDPAYSGGGTGYSIGSAEWREVLSTITDRFWSFTSAIADGSAYPPSSPQPATLCDGTTSGIALAGMQVFREYADDDTDVETTWRLLSNSATITGVARTLRVGVAARVRAGSVLSAGTADACLDQLDGYFAGELFSAVGGHRYMIWRANAGTIARLWTNYDSDAASVASPVEWSTFVPWQTRGVRMTVEGTGATVTVKLYALARDGWTLLATVLDTSGSRITASGRVGLFTGHELEVGGGLFSVPAHNYFQAGPVGGAPALRDEWTRTNRSACSARSVGSGQLATLPTGRDLASAFYGDAHGVSGFVSRIGENSSNARLIFDATSLAKTGYYTSQRPSTSAVAQDRKLTVIFPSGGASTTERWVGVAVRLAHATAGANPTAGYRADLRRSDTGGAHDVYLSRIESTGLITPLAVKQGVTVSTDTAYELRLVASNAGPDPFASDPLLSVYLDGAQVVLVSLGGAGVTVSGSGTVRDGASAHVVQGSAEGIYVRLTSVGGTRTIIVDDWTQGAGDASTPDNDDEQASYAVVGESDGASGTFETPEDWPVEEVDHVAFYDHGFDSGHRYTGARSEPRRVWKIGAKALDDSEVATLRAFVDDHAGAPPTYRAVPFSWTPPGEASAIVCRFIGAGLVRRLVAADVTEYDILLAETLS